MLNFLSKSLKLHPSFKFFTVQAGQFRIFVFEPPFGSRKYVTIPSSIEILKTDGNLSLILRNMSPKSVMEYNCSVSLLSYFFSFFLSPFKKSLVLNGLGFKAEVVGGGKSIQFKLGFSCVITVKIPQDIISVKVDKNIIEIEGCSAQSVGNFTETIRRLKFPDSYKGKGFQFEGVQRVLKEIKKT